MPLISQILAKVGKLSVRTSWRSSLAPTYLLSEMSDPLEGSKAKEAANSEPTTARPVSSANPRYVEGACRRRKVGSPTIWRAKVRRGAGEVVDDVEPLVPDVRVDAKVLEVGNSVDEIDETSAEDAEVEEVDEVDDRVGNELDEDTVKKLDDTSVEEKDSVDAPDELMVKELSVLDSVEESEDVDEPVNDAVETETDVKEDSAVLRPEEVLEDSVDAVIELKVNEVDVLGGTGPELEDAPDDVTPEVVPEEINLVVLVLCEIGPRLEENDCEVTLDCVMVGEKLVDKVEGKELVRVDNVPELAEIDELGEIPEVDLVDHVPELDSMPVVGQGCAVVLDGNGVAVDVSVQSPQVWGTGILVGL